MKYKPMLIIGFLFSLLLFYVSSYRKNEVPECFIPTIVPSSAIFNVTPSFPYFNEADTVKSEVGEISRQMNYAKVFTISLPDTSFKSALINSLYNLSEVLYTESNGDASTNIIPVNGRYSQQWRLHNTLVPNADIHAETAWDISTGNPNSIIAVIDAGVDINHSNLAAKIDSGDNTAVVTNNSIEKISPIEFFMQRKWHLNGQ